MLNFLFKIEGSTIPINNARPNRNLCITKKEPIGKLYRHCRKHQYNEDDFQLFFYQAFKKHEYT